MHVSFFLCVSVCARNVSLQVGPMHSFEIPALPAFRGGLILQLCSSSCHRVPTMPQNLHLFWDPRVSRIGAGETFVAVVLQISGGARKRKCVPKYNYCIPYRHMPVVGWHVRVAVVANRSRRSHRSAVKPSAECFHVWSTGCQGQHTCKPYTIAGRQVKA